ncbi:MAG: ribbon-helix-helix protein, CopG family [Acidimicrobiia bacterium]
MSEPKTHSTKSGRRILTDQEIEALASEVEETDYDVETLRTRRRGRPTIGSGPADVVPVRIDPELKAAIEARAAADRTTTSEIIREALRRFLDVA